MRQGEAGPGKPRQAEVGRGEVWCSEAGQDEAVRGESGRGGERWVAEGHSVVGVESFLCPRVVRVEVGGDIDGDETAGAVRGPVGDE